MTSPCDQVMAALAAGRPLGEAEREHAGQCESCGRLLELPGRIHAATALRSAVDPGPGFVARVTRGAVEVRARRRRHRIAGLAACAAGAAALVVALGLRPGSSRHSDPAPPAADSPAPQPVLYDTRATEQLLYLADVDGALSFDADWDSIEQPLDGLRLLARQGDRP